MAGKTYVWNNWLRTHKTNGTGVCDEWTLFDAFETVENWSHYRLNHLQQSPPLVAGQLRMSNLQPSTQCHVGCQQAD